jgi:hypothetical protein
VVETVDEAGGLADAVVVDPAFGDVRLVGEGGQAQSTKGDCSTVSIGSARLIDMNRRDGRPLLGVMLRAPEVPQVPGEQLAAAPAAAVVIQVVVHK